MFNLYQMVTGAQGGQGLENLAAQFGLTREQADGAVKALVPALSTAFIAKAAQPGGLGDIAGALTDDHHKQAYADPSVAQAPETEQKGSDVAGSIFGDNAIVEQVVAQAARFTGLPEATLRAMLPVIVSLVMGGSDPAASLPPMVQAGLDMFAKMFQAGVPSSPAQPADLGAKIDSSHAARQ